MVNALVYLLLMNRNVEKKKKLNLNDNLFENRVVMKSQISCCAGGWMTNALI